MDRANRMSLMNIDYSKYIPYKAVVMRIYFINSKVTILRNIFICLWTKFTNRMKGGKLILQIQWTLKVVYITA